MFIAAMRIKRYLSGVLITAFFVSLALTSWRKEADAEYEYFVSRDHVFSISKADIDGMIDNLEDHYPDLNVIKQLIESGVIK